MMTEDLEATCARLRGLISIIPLHKDLGAVVEGLDLAQPLHKEQQDLLLAALNRFDALVFPGQDLSPADEERIVRYFPHDGEVEAL